MDTEYLQTMNLKLQDEGRFKQKDLNLSLQDLESNDSSKDDQAIKKSLKSLKRSTQNSDKMAKNPMSQSMMVLPSEKQPKALVNKLSHIMKDTKNSAIRRAA
jgi:hypothetical protein